MDYQNITLSIPKEILKQARLIAVQNDKSLSKLLCEYIEPIVQRESHYQQAYQRQIKCMERGLGYILEKETLPDREALHER